MQKISNNSPSFRIKKVSQITDSHCGPAVIQMLLSNIGIEATQEEITKAANVQKTINTHGTRVDQLARAVKKLASQTRFWYKDHARLDDIRILLRTYNYPVGVEWQGIFGKGKHKSDGDYGHYSVTTNIDDAKQELIIVDPYKDYALQDRIISVRQFMNRWWDTNEVINSKTKRKKLVKDTKMLFIITPKDALFPKELGMKYY